MFRSSEATRQYETIFFPITLLLTILFLPGGLITLPGKVMGLLRRRTDVASTPRPAVVLPG